METAEASHKLNIHKVSEEGHTLLRFEGVIDEDFSSEKLLSGLSSTLVLCLAGVKRMTSFGIREWVAFNSAVSDRCKQVLLVDLSPRAVTQLNMVIGFVGRGHVLSLQAPYLCQRCGSTLLRRMDVLQHLDEMRGTTMAAQVCEACGGPAIFDDSPSTFFYFVGTQPRPSITPQTAAFLARHLNFQIGQALTRLKVAKVVDGQQTVLRLVGDLDEALPVTQIKEGLEGEVAFDLSGISRISPSGEQLWQTMLDSLAAQVDRIRLFGCPVTFLPSYRQFLPSNGSGEILSILLPYRCNRCATSTRREVDLLKHSDEVTSASPPVMTCDDCHDPLTCSAEPAMLVSCSSIAMPEPADKIWDLMERSRRSPDLLEAAGTAPVPTPRKVWPWIVGSAAFLCAATAIAFLAMHLLRPEPPRPVLRSKYYEASHLTPPPWKDKRVFVEAGRVIAVGRSTLSGDKSTAFAESSHAATEELLDYVAAGITDRGLAPLLASARRLREEAMTKYELAVRLKDKRQIEQIGRTLAGMRQRIARGLAETSRQVEPPVIEDNYWESFRSEGDRLYRVWARASMRAAAIEQLKQHYVAKIEVLGVTAVPLFPILCWHLPVDRGALVVAVADGSALGKAGLQVGDIVLSANGHPINEATVLKREVEQEQSTLKRTGGKLELAVIRARKDRLIVSLAVPKAPPPRGGPRHPGDPDQPSGKIWDDDPNR
jgi:anti-anti-sigma regulatory factor